MAAYKAFLNPGAADDTTFASARNSRYDLFWSLYWNNAYDTLTSYIQASGYPANSKLYRYTRGLRNPVGRWVDFYLANIWGGVLDMQAGDGVSKPSALPIVTENEALRPAISRLWQWSNWNSKRNLATLHSTTLGDVVLKVVDRPQSGKVYLQTLWPGHVTKCDWDDFGFVKNVVIEYGQVDDKGRGYTYKEVIEHPSVWGGMNTRFSTYKNGGLHGYPENDNLAQWETPYDFVPVVTIPWMDAGSSWGAVGFSKTVRKIDAANALASQLADQVGKAVNTPLVAYGVQPGDVLFTTDQEGIPILYVNRAKNEAGIEPLIGDLNLEHGLAILSDQLADIQEDLPELRLAESLRSGMSGEALGRAFSDVMARVALVRANHDSGLARAQQMAIAIAGTSRYHPDFNGFDMGSYASGKLDHNIGARPILPRDASEQLEEEERRWAMVSEATASGVPLETALREIMNWDDEQMADMGTQRMAQITLAQEDVTDGITQ